MQQKRTTKKPLIRLVRSTIRSQALVLTKGIRSVQERILIMKLWGICLCQIHRKERKKG